MKSSPSQAMMWKGRVWLLVAILLFAVGSYWMSGLWSSADAGDRTQTLPARDGDCSASSTSDTILREPLAYRRLLGTAQSKPSDKVSEQSDQHSLRIVVLDEAGQRVPGANVHWFEAHSDAARESLAQLKREGLLLEGQGVEGGPIELCRRIGQSTVTDETGTAVLACSLPVTFAAESGGKSAFDCIEEVKSPVYVTIKASRRATIRVTSEGEGVSRAPLSILWNREKESAKGMEQIKSQLGYTDRRGRFELWRSRQFVDGFLALGGKPEAYVAVDIPGGGLYRRPCNLHAMANGTLDLEIALPPLCSASISFVGPDRICIPGVSSLMIETIGVDSKLAVTAMRMANGACVVPHAVKGARYRLKVQGSGFCTDWKYTSWHSSGAECCIVSDCHTALVGNYLTPCDAAVSAVIYSSIGVKWRGVTQRLDDGKRFRVIVPTTVLEGAR